MRPSIINFLISLPIFLVAVIVHEYAHGWIAYKLGDPTPKYSGRLTLNPLVHIDPIGTLILPLFLLISGSRIIFGWAKPMPVNFLSLRHPKKDIFWVGLAGPLANISLALLLSVLLKLKLPLNQNLFELIVFAILINLVLAVFNIIPIPPLDGSRLVTALLPWRYAHSYNKLEPFGFIILIGLLYLGLLNRIIWPIVLVLSKVLGL